jgi:hypothetical protein
VRQQAARAPAGQAAGGRFLIRYPLRLLTEEEMAGLSTA